VADAAADRDWRTAAHHYREAGEHASVAETISRAVPEIIGRGQHGAAAEEIGLLPGDVVVPGLDLVRSRIEMQQRETTRGIALSSGVLAAVDPGSFESDYALLNLAALHMQTGAVTESLRLTDQLRETTSDEHLRMIAHGMSLLIAASGVGDLGELSDQLMRMAEKQRGIYPHFFGVTMLNLALVSTLQDRPGDAIAHATEAIDALEGTSSRIELSAAYMARAVAEAHLGAVEQAAMSMEMAAAFDEVETLFERGDLADSLLNPLEAERHLAVLARNSSRNSEAVALLNLQRAWFFGRRRKLLEADHARKALATVPEVPTIAFGTARACAIAYVAVVSDSPVKLELARQALDLAAHQSATRWERVAELLLGYATSSDSFDGAVRSVGTKSPWNLTFVADLIVDHVDAFGSEAWELVLEAARRHPARWRFAARQCIDAPGDVPIRVATLLDHIGDRDDIKRLRALARRHRRSPAASELGRGLARRLAEPVLIQDLGAVLVTIGPRRIPGSTIRRKVLALLCFLLTKSSMTAPRDQVLDAIWPDLDPVDALNSLNQTVYFLRRVFEESYVDDLSPGYVHHESDLIWLDHSLIASRSNDCRALIKAFPTKPNPDQVSDLVARYDGRFAVDFEYEEWASPYRDWLHAAYLEIVERAVASDLETGHFDRGISVARRVLDVDPTAENVELSLLRLYRASGAHNAAAEQYAHYATTLRDQLGIEPPPLSTL
jgi:DNA-binding SARP family transcriptional activator